MPQPEQIRSAEATHLACHAAEFGAVTGSVVVDMAKVRRCKREMVERQVAKHWDEASVTQLIMGEGHYAAPKTLEAGVHGAATRTFTADKTFINVWDDVITCRRS